MFFAYILDGGCRKYHGPNVVDANPLSEEVGFTGYED